MLQLNVQRDLFGATVCDMSRITRRPDRLTASQCRLRYRSDLGIRKADFII